MNIPILGNNYYLYFDEAGHIDKDLSNERFFCIGTVAKYQDLVCLPSRSNYIQIAKGTESSFNNHRRVASIINEQKLIVTISTIDLRNEGFRYEVVQRYNKMKDKSIFPVQDKSSIRNWLWTIAFSMHFMHTIGEFIRNRQRVGTIEIFYNEVKLKKREEYIIQNDFKNHCNSLLSRIISNLEMEFPLFLKGDTYPVVAKVSPVKKDNFGIKIIDNVVSGYRKKLLDNNKDKFLESFSSVNIDFNDLTTKIL